MKACMLPDYASQSCNGRLLERVGVHEIVVQMIGMENVIVMTKQSLYVELHGKNGVHMSRLVSILESVDNIRINNWGSILDDAIKSHDAAKAFWVVSWEDIITFDVNGLRTTKVVIPMTLEGAMIKGSEPEWFWTFKFPYASVCPCSAEMTRSVGKGHPHMQRATATVTLQLENGLQRSILYSIAEVVGLIPVSLMKREDELRWCQLASEFNLFVEDAARVIGDVLDNSSIPDWVVVCEHEESIHQHNVVAVCRKGGRLS